MQWPSSTYSEELFPSLGGGFGLPEFPENSPVWTILDPNSKSGLRVQLLELISQSTEGVDIEDLDCTYDDTKGAIYISKTAIIGPSVHIIGPCFIGDGAEVRHGAYVREYSWICNASIVGHCTEVKHSILLPGAKAPHFNYVGNSILGSGVNLGAGTKLSNLRNDGKEVNVRIDGNRHGTGLRKFGAILGENCQLGCNSVTNPGVVIGRDGFVHPNATVTGIFGPSSRIS